MQLKMVNNLQTFKQRLWSILLLNQHKKQKSGPDTLPFKYVDDTAADEGPELDKFFKNILTDQIKPTRILAETKGKDRKAIQALFGKIEDPRFSIYNSMTKLSAIARKNELFERIAKQDEAVKKQLQKIHLQVQEVSFLMIH